MELLRAIGKKHIKKRMLAVLMMAAVIFANYQAVNATKIDDAKETRDDAQQNLDEVNERIEEIKDAQSSLMEEMEAYDDQLMALLTDMELLESDIDLKQEEIDIANERLAAAEEREQEQYEAMKLRIQYMYENGDSSILAAIAGAADITDFLNRVEYVSDVYDYDRAQLTAYQETVQQIADLTDQLKTDLAEMEELELSYQEQKGELEYIISEKSAQMENFNAKLADAKNLAGQYAETIRQQNQIIAAEQARIAAEAAERERQAAAQAAAAAAASGGGETGGSNTSGGGDTTGGSSASGSESSGSESSGNGLTTTGLNPSYTSGVSGSDVVAYAQQFVGNPYVYGGNSLTEGCDCSYFVMACFQKYGISLPRSSYKMQSSGQAVSYDCAQPGDIICYSGHVAIYMGNGKIVHASSPTNGICYGTATYRTIVTIRRVL